jgi:hypothetical protein
VTTLNHEAHEAHEGRSTGGLRSRPLRIVREDANKPQGKKLWLVCILSGDARRRWRPVERPMTPWSFVSFVNFVANRLRGPALINVGDSV